MRRIMTLLFVLIGVIAATNSFAALSPDNVGAQEPTVYSGWYIEHSTERLFIPCGQNQPLRLTAPASLHDKARQFGLHEDTPVYVELRGAPHGDGLTVTNVEQFGSNAPLRNCPPMAP